MIHFVTALRAEAEPLIRSLEMEPSPSGHGFLCFSGENSRLVVCGVGRIAAAEATASLQRAAAGEPAVWLNVGLAAHRHLTVGEAVVAHKIVELDSDRCWYPQLVVDPALRSATVCTVDRAVRTPVGDRVYEMEASGFFSAAMSCTTAELAGCVKVISDRGISSADERSSEVASRLVGECVPEVLTWARRLEALLAERGTPRAMEDLSPILERWHLTVTQQHQLRRLARRAAALGTSATELMPPAAGSSRRALRTLEGRIDRMAMRRPVAGERR